MGDPEHLGAAAPPSKSSPQRPARFPHERRVPIWYSTRVRLPKWHLDSACQGLEGVQVDWRGQSSATLLGLFTNSKGRPCRRCTLETVLTAVREAPSLNRGPVELVTFSGQPNPRELSPYGFGYREVSDSGAARLVRIASAWHLDCVEGTQAGPVAWGVLPARLAGGLSRNLRTVRSRVVPVDGARHVALMWEMLVNRPPEIIDGATADPVLLWQMSRAIVAPAGSVVGAAS